MAVQIAGIVAKTVETGKKVVEVAKKAEETVSKVEKPIKALEKVTADKNENWGSDIVKMGAHRADGGVKSGITEKLKEYLGKDEISSDATDVQKDISDKPNETKENQQTNETGEGRDTLKDKLNKYLDSSDSQVDESEKTKGEVPEDDKTTNLDMDDLTQDNDENHQDENEGDEHRRNDDSGGGNEVQYGQKEGTSETGAPEYNEDGTRELTEDEKQELKDKLAWSDEKLKKCTIDKDGVIHYKTDRCDLEGKTSENGVPYERRRITINGVVIEGVFPKFESVFDTELDPENYKTKAYAKECNAKLKEAIENDPELRSKFTEEQLKDIEEGRTPTGYVWHHNEEPGKMQLVKREDHDRAIGGAAHTGGNSLWGADSTDNSKKGESF